ncbi:MAG TPA: helix-turn-helix domain-containing protein [Burkholderiales bacterium]|nr:helix-turn-helix domain-containing protein [Burkholderiales bacterium]
MLIAIIPLNLVLIAVLVALHTGVRLFNASITMPIALMFFLALTAYATHQYRLFDIQYFIPWSKVHKRKTAFYDRIRSMIAEIADLASVNQVVNRLADTLRCPVALVGGPNPEMSSTKGVMRMLSFPMDELRKVEHIVIANEIAQVAPTTHHLMKQHGVAAIVPFYPRSRTAASWMLLGDSFNEQVYTPLDFKMVEKLFEHMAEQFLDKLLFLRSQLHEARDQLQTLQYRLDEADTVVAKLREQNSLLRQYNFRLLRERGDTSVDVSAAKSASEPAAEKSLAEHVSQFEARLIAQALKQCGGNKSQAARILGLRANTLHYKIERYGLTDKGKSEGGTE